MLLKIADAARRNPPTSNATLAEVENEIKIWTRGAPDRHGGRTERAKRKLQERANKLARRRRWASTYIQDYGSRHLNARQSRQVETCKVFEFFVIIFDNI